MSRDFVKNRLGLVSVAIIVALIEGSSFVRWIAFDGPKPDWQYPLLMLFGFWAIGNVAEWLEQRDDRRKSQLNDIETRLEALYKWGSIYSDQVELDEEEERGQDGELDTETKAKIAEYEKDIKSGESDYQYHLGVLYWNLAMKHYNPRTTEGYRKAIYWLRKALKQGYDCESTLAEAYLHLHDYDQAMLWYRRIVKRRDRLAHIAEANIGDMYAEGQGVSQNYAEAAKWWANAGAHGWKWASYSLGKLYAEGKKGVPPNTREAYFNLYIASSGKGSEEVKKHAANLLEETAKKLNRWELEREQKRADEWLAGHP
jgi:TPR repeat protein